MTVAAIHITTKIEEQTSEFHAKASVNKIADGVLFRYPIDGDVSELTVRDGEIVTERFGRTHIFACFRRGERSEMTVEAFGQVGSISVRTDICDIQISSARIFASLEYEMLIPASPFRVQLKISIDSEDS